MRDKEVKNYLINSFKFDPNTIEKLEYFCNRVLSFNKSYNLISASTEPNIWTRHVLDSAQLIKFIDFENSSILSDFGSGAGFPGLILAIYNKNPNFHVKLFEKSKVKASFLGNMVKELDINAQIVLGDIREKNIDCEYVVCRAFRKLPEILRISREKLKKPHKIIILKGKNAQEEVNKALKEKLFKYKLVDSITDKESKILLIDAHNSE